MTAKQISNLIEAASAYLYNEKMAEKYGAYCSLTAEEEEDGLYQKERAMYEYWQQKNNSLVAYETASGVITTYDFVTIINLVSEYGKGTAENMVKAHHGISC